MPYEKKIVEYQDRKVVKKVPVKRKVLEYQERKYIEKIPREVVKTDYYPVERIVEKSSGQRIEDHGRPESTTKISFVSI